MKINSNWDLVERKDVGRRTCLLCDDCDYSLVVASKSSKEIIVKCIKCNAEYVLKRYEKRNEKKNEPPKAKED